MRDASDGSTMTAPRRCRLRFVVLFVKKWFLFALWRLSFPELVRENRLAHPLWVFIFGMSVRPFSWLPNGSHA